MVGREQKSLLSDLYEVWVTSRAGRRRREKGEEKIIIKRTSKKKKMPRLEVIYEVFVILKSPENVKPSVNKYRYEVRSSCAKNPKTTCNPIAVDRG